MRGPPARRYTRRHEARTPRRSRRLALAQPSDAGEAARRPAGVALDPALQRQGPHRLDAEDRGLRLGDNFANTFRVEDGVLVATTATRPSTGRFGHLFYARGSRTTACASSTASPASRCPARRTGRCAQQRRDDPRPEARRRWRSRRSSRSRSRSSPSAAAARPRARQSRTCAMPGTNVVIGRRARHAPLHGLERADLPAAIAGSAGRGRGARHASFVRHPRIDGQAVPRVTGSRSSARTIADAQRLSRRLGARSPPRPRRSRCSPREQSRRVRQVSSPGALPGLETLEPSALPEREFTRSRIAVT